jgi:hypothetical protein
MKICALWAVAVIVLISGLAPTGAAADRVVIHTYGVTPFVYGGYSYVPLKTATDFLGAALLWDSLRNRATITYHGRELGLAVGGTTAYYGGRPVALPVPPVIVGEQMLVPASVFNSYLGVPVRWDQEARQLEIQSPSGWGYYRVLPYPPPHAVAIIQRHAPPPWAPAYGRRRHGYRGHYYPALYAPAPFIYSGITYIPLRSAADFIGAALLWDHLRNRAVITYNGREIGLVVGSPTVYLGPQVIVLPAAPVVVHDTVFVPADLFVRHLRIPIERSGGVIKIKGEKGWREMRLASPPGPQFISGWARGKVQPGPVVKRGPKQARQRSPFVKPQARPGPAHGPGRGPTMKKERAAPGPKSAGPPQVSAPHGKEGRKGGGREHGTKGGSSKENKGGGRPHDGRKGHGKGKGGD